MEGIRAYTIVDGIRSWWEADNSTESKCKEFRKDFVDALKDDISSGLNKRKKEEEKDGGKS